MPLDDTNAKGREQEEMNRALKGLLYDLLYVRRLLEHTALFHMEQVCECTTCRARALKVLNRHISWLTGGDDHYGIAAADGEPF